MTGVSLKMQLQVWFPWQVAVGYSTAANGKFSLPMRRGDLHLEG